MGRKKALTDTKLMELKEALGQQKTKEALAKEFNISVPTVYRYQKALTLLKKPIKN